MNLEAIFLDRDGTLNYDYGYLGEPDKIKILPGVIEGLKIIKEKFPEVKLIVISNQAGVARGIISIEQVNKVNNRISSILEKEGIFLDKFYFCPFHPEFSSEEEVSCRKPSPEMVFHAAKDFNINLQNTFFIGDRTSDVECGKNAGCKTILLNSEIYKNELNLLKKSNKLPDYFARNFRDAINFILSKEILAEESS